MPVKKPVRSKTSTASDKSTTAAKPARSNAPAGTGTWSAGAIVFIMVCVVAAAMLLAARDVSDVTTVETFEVQPTVAAATPAQVQKPAASKTTASAAVPPKATPAKSTPASAPAAPSTPKLSPMSSPVTIAGCLEGADGRFRLTDTAGANAPKSRSWKSGFLKKGSASIELSDAASAFHLSDHVGRRVSVTGMLNDREMRVHSLRRVAASCK